MPKERINAWELSEALQAAFRERVRNQIGDQADKVFGIFEGLTRQGTRQIHAFQSGSGPFMPESLFGISVVRPDRFVAEVRLAMLQSSAMGDMVDDGVLVELKHISQVDGPPSYVFVTLGGVGYDHEHARVCGISDRVQIRDVSSPEFEAFGREVITKFRREIRVARNR